MTEDTSPIDRLRSLLRELLQLDLSDLDFGIYRLLRLKRDEVEAFLDEQLPTSVAEAFAAVGEEQRADAEAEVTALAARLREDVAEDVLNADGSVRDQYRDIAARAIRELIEQYESARGRVEGIRTSDAQQAEVFNHLYEFFRRYYEDGDFIPKRRITRRGHERYVVPYGGEETLLHWANQGQHYVKNAEVFRDYAFRIEGDLLSEPCRVRFELSSASVPPGDTKGDTRYFFPLAEDVEWDGETRTLRVPFHYRRLTTPEAESFGRRGIQETILEDSLAELRAALQEGELVAALLPGGTGEGEADDGEPDVPPLLRHLRRFVRRNTADYFVHRDLAGFLERELEFYIKDQILHLADLEGDLVARQRMLRVLRSVAGMIIAFLAELEEVQKRLFEKRKLVLSAEYLVLISALPRDLWAEVLANSAQLDEWKRLFHIDPEESLFNPDGAVNEAFLEQHPTLVVNTALFDDDFRYRVLGSFEDIDEATGGILVHSENYQALRLLEPRFRGQVKCIYIDPPYNTASDDFLYKDRYRHSSWLAMMEERLRLARAFLRTDGVLFASIDGTELPRLRELMDRILGDENRLAEVVWHNARDNNPTRIAVEHEYVLSYAKDSDDLEPEWKSRESYAKSLLLDKFEELQAQGLGRESMTRRFRQFIKDNSATIGKLQRYKHIDSEGPYTGSESVHNPHPGGYDYELVHPKTGEPMNKPANGYRFPEDTMRTEYLEKDRLIFGPDANRIVKIKLYLTDYQEAFRSVVRLDSRLGAYSLRNLFGTDRRVFKNPKAVELIQQLISFATEPSEYILDFVAGSGTTAEAAIRLGSADRSQRRFLLVEMGSHFDSIVVPRVCKLLYTTDWRKGEPSHPGASESQPLPLIKILRLESYEDSLHNLVSAETSTRAEPRQTAVRAAVGDDKYRIKYLARLPMEASASLLNVEKLAHPFRYELEILTDDGPEVRKVDLVETFNLIYGLKVGRIDRWLNEDDGDDGRPYVVVIGEDPEGQRTLVLWRDMENLDPSLERAFLESMVEAAADTPFDVILINGDSTVPGVRSLDPDFKTRICEGEVG